ncbi:MAG: hypothetical protein AAF085_01440, partial [Planctomycetota bacterium]
MSISDSIAVQGNEATATMRWQIERGGDGLVVVRGENTPNPEPADWRERLGWFITNTPGVAMVGAKRFTPEGHV